MIEEAVQDVVTVLTDAGLDRGDGQPLTVTDYMPLPGDLDKPAAAVVTFTAMSDTDIGVTITLAVDTSSDVESAEKSTRTLCEAVDGALNATAAPRSEWSKAWSAEYSAHMVSTTLVYPRGDF